VRRSHSAVRLDILRGIFTEPLVTLPMDATMALPPSFPSSPPRSISVHDCRAEVCMGFQRSTNLVWGLSLNRLPLSASETQAKREITYVVRAPMQCEMDRLLLNPFHLFVLTLTAPRLICYTSFAFSWRT